VNEFEMEIESGDARSEQLLVMPTESLSNREWLPHCKKAFVILQLQLLPELQLWTRNSPLWQPALAIQHTWSTGTAQVATRAVKFA